MKRKKITIAQLNKKKEQEEQITMLTCYDYPMALLQEKAGIDIILVGDSLGMTVLGYDTTLPVDMDTMIVHARAVRRGAPTAYLIGDMPYMTYQISEQEAIRNAGRFMSEAGVDAIKLEGGENVVNTIRALVNATIPVMGHIGLTPQSLAQLGGFKAQGRDTKTALKLIDDAQRLEEAGISTLLVEAVPAEIAEIITEKLTVPVISLGSGATGHGQCLIVHDMLGFFDKFTPKFVKKYCNLNNEILEAFGSYVEDVKGKKFPEELHTYPLDPKELDEIKKALGSF